jgi:hypothetical protein
MTLDFKETFILGAMHQNIPAFQELCKEHGAHYIFSKPLEKKADLDFDQDIIAFITNEKLAKEVEKNEFVIAIAAPAAIVGKIKTKKPLLSFGATTAKVDAIISETIIESDVPVLLQNGIKNPEEAHQAIRKGVAGIIFTDIALNRPVIFEQCINYMEKGYYNKVTRKRREKMVDAFEKLSSKHGLTADVVNSYKTELLEH